MWYWERMEEIIWTDLVGNVEVLHKVKETELLYKKRRIKLTLLVKSCMGTAFSNVLLKGR